MPQLGFLVAMAVLGLAVGSVLTTVIMRLPYGRRLLTAARCPACERRLSVGELIPVVSWLLLRGRCRECGAALGWRYPSVELLTGALFVVVSWRVGLQPHLAAYLYLVAVGVCLAVIDIDVHRLPDLLTLPSYGALGGLLAIACTLDGQWVAFGRAVACSVGLFAIYYLVAVVAPNGMGFGDVKFAGVLGLALGFAGWGVALSGIVLGFLFGGLISGVLLLFGWVKRTTRIAFGPFMLAGALAALLIGEHAAVATLGLAIA